MKIFVAICLAMICLAAAGQDVSRQKRAELTAVAERYAAKLDNAVNFSPRTEIAPGLTAEVHWYRGPRGRGQLVVFKYTTPGATNTIRKVIDLGPEGRDTQWRTAR